MEIEKFVINSLTREGYVAEVRRISYEEDISYKAAQELLEKARKESNVPPGYKYSTLRTYLTFIGPKGVK